MTATAARRPRTSRRLSVGLVAVVAFALVASLTSCSSRPTDYTKAILFVHGYNFSPAQVDCGGTFDTMISALKAEGFTGPMVKVGYYSADTNCNVDLHDWGSYGDRDSWKNIAEAFSNYVYKNYTSKGITVDVVGYSMGALVARGAIYGAETATSGFGPPIDVQDYVSLGGPHDGAAWYTYGCLWGQCSSMKPGSDDLDWLNQNRAPGGKNGTDITEIGSKADTTVPYASATYMTLNATNVDVFDTVTHSGDDNYTHDAAVIARAGLALANDAE